MCMKFNMFNSGDRGFAEKRRRFKSAHLGKEMVCSTVYTLFVAYMKCTKCRCGIMYKV